MARKKTEAVPVEPANTKEPAGLFGAAGEHVPPLQPTGQPPPRPETEVPGKPEFEVEPAPIIPPAAAPEREPDTVEAEFTAVPETESGLSADQRLALRMPELGGNVVGLSMIPDRARDILQARIDILRTLRTASIKATFATDWVKYLNKDTGQELAFLQDSGCERVIKLWNIVSLNGPPVAEKLSADGVFQYVFQGSARSAMTGEEALDIEGTRYSDDPFFKNVKGLRLEYLVKKAARANWDGNVLRTIAGLGNVPVEELGACGINTEKCHKGRGYDRTPEGADVVVKDAGIPVSQYPKCPKCGGDTKFIPGRNDEQKQYPAFFGCKKPREACGGKTIDHATWVRKIKAESGGGPSEAQSGGPEPGAWVCERPKRITIENMRKTLMQRHGMTAEELSKDLEEFFQEPGLTLEKLSNERAAGYITHLAGLVNNRATG